MLLVWKKCHSSHSFCLITIPLPFHLLFKNFYSYSAFLLLIQKVSKRMLSTLDINRTQLEKQKSPYNVCLELKLYSIRKELPAVS